MKGKKSFYILVIALLGAIIISYSNHFRNEFHFDDFHTICSNPYIKSLKNIPLFFKDATTFSTLPANQLYRPVVTTTLAICYWMGNGLNPFYFHLVIFILFLVQCIFLYFLFLKIFNISYKHKFNKYIALLGAGWYGLHTANAETVNYIISCSDSISTLMIVIAMVMYQYSKVSRKYYLYLLPVIIGLLTKQTAITFAPILLVYIILFDKNLSLTDLFKSSKFKQYKKSFYLSIPAFIACVLVAWFSGKMLATTYNPGGYSKFYYLITQPFVFIHYFDTFFLPFSLSVDSDWTVITSIFDDRFIVGIIFIVLMMYIVFKTSEKPEYRPVAFGILWFFIALLPTSSIIPLSEVLNDHRIFYPFVGLMISVCWTIGMIIIKNEKKIMNTPVYRNLIITGIVILLSSHAYGTYQRNKVWNNEESLWLDCTIKSPKNGRGLMNYGLTQMSKGKYDVALTYFEKALVYNPYYSILHINLGVVKNSLGRYNEAERHFKDAISYGQYSHEAYYYYANFLKQHYRESEAIPYLEKSIQAGPNYMYSRYLLMDIYNELGMWDKLTQLTNETLRLFPGDKEALKYIEASKNKKSKVQVAEDTAVANPTPENYLNLSLIYYQLGNMKNVLKHVSRL
ncbi:MAG: hypothetical protein Q8880_13060 [Bacteroidota bacterium]|nr:hypothetical protein [Bacteroidota bacterium]